MHRDFPTNIAPNFEFLYALISNIHVNLSLQHSSLLPPNMCNLILTSCISYLIISWCNIKRTRTGTGIMRSWFKKWMKEKMDGTYQIEEIWVKFRFKIQKSPCIRNRWRIRPFPWIRIHRGLGDTPANMIPERGTWNLE